MDKATDAAITHVMEPMLPATYTPVTVGGADAATQIFARRLDNGPSPAPGQGPDQAAAEEIALEIVQRTGDCLTIDVPGGGLAVWALAPEPDCAPDSATLVNRPRLDWSVASGALAGEELILVGRNLASPEHYPTNDPEHPVSFGGLLPGKTRIVARRQGGEAWQNLPVARSSCYEAYVDVPPSLTPGDYELCAHNGLGGVRGWSEAFAIQVEAAPAWPADVVEVDSFLAAGGDVDAAIAAALAQIESRGGGVLQFGPGAYALGQTIVLPRRTVLRGMGMQRTMLRLPAGGGPKPPWVAITGDGDFAVEDIRIQGVYAPLLICAPTFLPSSFDEAFDIPFTFSPLRARNVHVRRCYLRQSPTNHIDRRQDSDGGAWKERMQEYVLSPGQGYTGLKCVHLKGDDLSVEDCTMWGGGACVLLAGCSHSRVAGNTLKVGPCGHGIYAAARLHWPEDGGGAYRRQLRQRDIPGR